MDSALIVSPNAEQVGVLKDSLSKDTRVDIEHDCAVAFKRASDHPYDLIFVDISLILGERFKVGGTSLVIDDALTEFVRGQYVIVLTHKDSVSKAVRLVEAGAIGYLTYPIVPAEVHLLLKESARKQKQELELQYLRDQVWQIDPEGIARTSSPKMRSLLRNAKSVATTKTSVLLTGESGVGKGVIARLIQKNSSRAEKPFIAVHCGAIAETLLESELFGHEKGAFTGADKRKLGKFELAQDGTIFLDEIGTITPALQIKLLQVLQDNVFYRVGGQTPVQGDFRILAATNAKLETMVAEGLFREDLFYRLNVFPIEVPPLRDRVEDIPMLVGAIINKINQSHLRQIKGIHPFVLEAFQRYPWPGNIRELENILERAFILEPGEILTPDSFSAELFAFGFSGDASQSGETPDSEAELTLADARRKGIEILEKDYLSALLEKEQGRIKNSAQIAGISPRQLHKLINKYSIRCDVFRSHK